ncbi:hypothetical protein C8R43DRAFT_1201219 [Mycena crocata]|nr:hypothetical protein C8R43DRAFT_1201219 [Mycena crocata]
MSAPPRRVGVLGPATLSTPGRVAVRSPAPEKFDSILEFQRAGVRAIIQLWEQWEVPKHSTPLSLCSSHPLQPNSIIGRPANVVGIHTIDSITFHVLVTHSAAFNLVRYSGGPASRVCGPKELSRISLAVSMTCRRRSITRRRCGVGLFPRGSTKILRSKSVKLINLLFRFQPQLCLGRLFVVNTLLPFVSPPFLFSILHTRTC